MSALGQKPTYALQQAMSALPPKADMCGATTDVRIYPKSVHCVRHLATRGELLMWWGMMDSWGYGGYGPFHTVIWIILAIAFVIGMAWRLRSGRD
jgi:hypothetical protein